MVFSLSGIDVDSEKISLNPRRIETAKTTPQINFRKIEYRIILTVPKDQSPNNTPANMNITVAESLEVLSYPPSSILSTPTPPDHWTEAHPIHTHTPH